MIYEQQNCSGGKRLYVKHPFYKNDVFKSVCLTEEQMCLVKDYLAECEKAGVSPKDLKIMLILIDGGKPLKFE